MKNIKTKDDLGKLKVVELREIAEENDIQIKGQIRKSELIKLLAEELLEDNGENVLLGSQPTDYKAMKVSELRELCKQKNIDVPSTAAKNDVIELLENYEEPAENEIQEEIIFNTSPDAKNRFNANEEKVIDKVSTYLLEVARKNSNIIADITLDVTLSADLGANYNKMAFARVEAFLNSKNVDIDYTSEDLKLEIAELQGEKVELVEEEINYSIDSILKGVGKKQETDEVKNFLSTINDYPLLSKEKEMELGQIIAETHAKKMAGVELTFFEVEKYEDARELLSLSNKRLVVSVAKKYINRGMDLIDLVMEGMLGLEKAILKYDYETGFKFSTYATWWVRQGITRAIADKSKIIRIPVHMVETINKVTKVQRELTQSLGQEPTYEQIGKQMDPVMSVEEIEHIFDIAKDPIALEMPIGEDNSSLESFIEDDKHMTQEQESEKQELRRKLLEIIEEIPEKEGEVLLYRYGLYDLNIEPLEKKLVELNEILAALVKGEITCPEVEDKMRDAKEISEKQKEKYVKRINQNNEKYEKKYSDYMLLRVKTDKKSIERVKKLEKTLEQIKDTNTKYLEKLCEITEKQIEILTKIDDLTGGIVKALTLEEVGQLFDVTRERIRQIETKGKRKLKAFADKEQLELYIHE